LAATAEGRSDRSLPVPLARRGEWNSGRSLVAGDGGPGEAGKGARHWGVELRPVGIEEARTHPPRTIAAAALLADPTRCRRDRDPMVQRESDRRDRIQSDAVGHPYRLVHDRESEENGRQRLAPEIGELSDATRRAEHRVA